MTASDHSYESPKDRASLVREAGLGRLSFPSILAGVLVAYGAFAVLAALVGTLAAAIGLNTDLNRNDWATLGLGSAIAVAVVLLAAYLFGGYVAGRMARRAGLLNGLAVFLLALLLVAVVGAVAASQTDAAAIGNNLRSLWHSKLTRRAVSGEYRPNHDDHPADRDQDRPAHDQTLDQPDRPTPDHKGDTGATRLTSPATQEATAEPVSRSQPDR
jgi:hypothetical protein